MLQLYETTLPQSATAEDIEAMHGSSVIAQTVFEFGDTEGACCPLFWTDSAKGKTAPTVTSRATLRKQWNKKLEVFRRLGQKKLELATEYARKYLDSGVNDFEWNGYELLMQESLLIESVRSLADPNCKPGSESYAELWGWIISSDSYSRPTQAFSFPACAMACGVDPAELRDKLLPLARGKGFSNRPLEQVDIERITKALCGPSRPLRIPD